MINLMKLILRITTKRQVLLFLIIALYMLAVSLLALG